MVVAMCWKGRRFLYGKMISYMVVAMQIKRRDFLLMYFIVFI